MELMQRRPPTTRGKTDFAWAVPVLMAAVMAAGGRRPSYKTPRSPWIRRLFPFETVRLRGVATGDRLTVWNGFGPTWEAYDLTGDPQAHRNLVALDPAAHDREVLEDLLRSSLGFWTEPRAIETPDDRKALEALGYF